MSDKGSRIIAALDMAQDWEKRIKALHDIIDHVESLDDQTQTSFLQNLRLPLKENILDRLSFYSSPPCLYLKCWHCLSRIAGRNSGSYDWSPGAGLQARLAIEVQAAWGLT